MVRPPDQRKRMYEAKVDPEILATQTRVLKALMVREETRYFPVITTIEEKVKKLVEAEGIPTLQVRDYLNFGREMYELTRKFSGSTLRGEAQLRVNKWSDRGLTGTLLTKVSSLFGVSLTAPPAPPSLPLCYPIVPTIGNYVASYDIAGGFTFWYDIWKDSVMVHSFPLYRETTFDKLAIQLFGTPTIGQKFRLGLYDSLPTGKPGNLVMESSELVYTGYHFLEEDIDLTLSPSQYWLGWHTDTEAGEIPIAEHGALLPAQFEHPYEFTLSEVRAYGKDQPYGPLPDPFGVPDWTEYTICSVLMRLKSYV